MATRSHHTTISYHHDLFQAEAVPPYRRNGLPRCPALSHPCSVLDISCTIGNPLLRRLIEKIKTHLSNHATTFISKLSDICLPLVYSPITSYLLPDALIRYAIRVRCSHTLIELGEHTIELDQERNMEIASELKSKPIAIETQSANNQQFLVLAAYYY